MSKTTPTQRSLKKLRAEGWLCAIVEKWNQGAGIRQDLFGVADLLCIRPGCTLAVQTTSGSQVPKHLAKLHAEPRLQNMLEAGWDVEVHGWRKLKVKRGGKATRWECRVVTLSGPTLYPLADLNNPLSTLEDHVKAMQDDLGPTVVGLYSRKAQDEKIEPGAICEVLEP